MPGIIHRYMRRVVRWAQTPSDEDEVALALAEEKKFRVRVRMSIPRLFNSHMIPSFWQGLGPNDARILRDEIEMYGKSVGARPERIGDLLRMAALNVPADSAWGSNVGGRN